MDRSPIIGPYAYSSDHRPGRGVGRRDRDLLRSAPEVRGQAVDVFGPALTDRAQGSRGPPAHPRAPRQDGEGGRTAYYHGRRGSDLDLGLATGHVRSLRLRAASSRPSPADEGSTGGAFAVALGCRRADAGSAPVRSPRGAARARAEIYADLPADPKRAGMDARSRTVRTGAADRTGKTGGRIAGRLVGG